MTNRRNIFRRGLSKFYIPYYESLCGILPDHWQPVSGLRSMEEQASLYAQGREKPGLVVTNAKPGLSFHNYGLATDWAYFPDNRYQPIGVADPMWREYVDACEKIGVQCISWEKPHNQLSIPARAQDLKREYDIGGFDAVNTYLERILNGKPTPAA